MQFGPQRVLGDPWLHRRAHLFDRPLAYRNGVAYQRNLARRLDLARILHHLEPVDDPVAQTLHLVDAVRRHPVYGDSLVPPVMLSDHRVQIRRPGLRLFRLPLSGQEVEKGNTRADLVDSGEPFAEQSVAPQLEQPDRTLGRDIDVTHLIVGAPDLHVRRIGNVACVHLVIEHDACEIVRSQGLAHPSESVVTHRVEVARCIGMLHRSVLSRRVVRSRAHAMIKS